RPSPAKLENGRLFGSLQTLRAFWGAAKAGAARAADKQTIPAASLRQREDIQGASFGSMLRKIGCRVDKSVRSGAVAHIQLVRHDAACPPATAGEHGVILLAVRSGVAYRLSDDARTCPELPKERACLSVHSLEIAFHGAVENDIARRYQRSAPHGKLLLNLPD